jgi:hypothetical protein
MLKTFRKPKKMGMRPLGIIRPISMNLYWNLSDGLGGRAKGEEWLTS